MVQCLVFQDIEQTKAGPCSTAVSVFTNPQPGKNTTQCSDESPLTSSIRNKYINREGSRTLAHDPPQGSDV